METILNMHRKCCMTYNQWNWIMWTWGLVNAYSEVQFASKDSLTVISLHVNVPANFLSINPNAVHRTAVHRTAALGWGGVDASLASADSWKICCWSGFFPRPSHGVDMPIANGVWLIPTQHSLQHHCTQHCPLQSAQRCILPNEGSCPASSGHGGGMAPGIPLHCVEVSKHCRECPQLLTWLRESDTTLKAKRLNNS
jgi:hypothetical protein